ncbi:hypothetical protein BJ138DRAFT_1139337 [Hygrophoropsis aurantiaca]|uniref:Uncharacterized protein n=1 Tax=Hygrophoropsis aurantiaca TaxID=72124 RepID=A0ACB8AVX3_9AGAM|nr:hypothetical protein BJ138DRAFT_1139337 [Hygrophoropsis aurantiaca]
MPACLSVSPCLLRSTTHPRSLALQPVFYHARKRRSRKTLGAGQSTVTVTGLSRSQRYSSEVTRHKDAEIPSKQHQTLTLLHKTASVLPRALPIGPKFHFWNDVLADATSELSSAAGSDACARIAVCGVDEWSGSRELVTALLEDPFTSDEAYSDIVRNRWKNHPESIVVEHTASTALTNHSSEGRLSIPSPWLEQFSFPIQLHEYLNLSSSASLRGLVGGDILVLVWNSLTTPLPTLISEVGHLLRRSNTILVISSSMASENVLVHLSKELSANGIRPAKILPIDPTRSLDAISSLKFHSNSSLAVQKYQDDFLGSRLSTLNTALAEYFVVNGADSSLPHLRSQTAIIQISSALQAGLQSVNGSDRATNEIYKGTSELQLQVEELRSKVELDVFGGSSGEDRVTKGLRDGAKTMRTVLDSMSWWKMVLGVDEIGMMIGNSLHKHWCKDLESQLILQTGRLSKEQQRLSRSTFAFLSNLSESSPNSTLSSPLLVNQLQQLISSPTYALTPISLTQPIHFRRAQLVKYTTARLHSDAQSAVLGTFGSVIGGAGIGWWLAFGESIAGFSGTGPETAVGVGMLIAVGGLRWAVGKWEKAKRRWIQDLERVGDGARHDLKVTLRRVFDGNVVVVPVTACEKLQDLLAKRQGEIDQIKDDLRILEVELDNFSPTIRDVNVKHC